MSEWVSEWVSIGLTTHRRLVSPVSHLHWYWQPNKNNQETEHTHNRKQHNAKRQRGPNRHNQKSRLRDRTDSPWFRHLFYDIRPGNGAGLFLQPRSTHGAGYDDKKYRCRHRCHNVDNCQSLTIRRVPTTRQVPADGLREGRRRLSLNNTDRSTSSRSSGKPIFRNHDPHLNGPACSVPRVAYFPLVHCMH